MYVIKVTWPKVDVHYYLNAAGRLGPLGDAFHYSKLSIAKIMVNLQNWPLCRYYLGDCRNKVAIRRISMI